jgi:type I restriction enzyme, S subunit
MTDGLKDKYRKAIITILTDNKRVEKVVLFGSRAMGTFTPTSDVDIALFGDNLTLTDQAKLAEAIDELSIPQRVDILLHKSIKNEKLIEHIKRYGVEWYRRPWAMESDWTPTTVGSFCPFTYGKGLPEKKRNTNGNIKVYGSNGPVGVHDQPLVDEPGIVIGRKGTVGAVHFASEPFWPIDTTFYVVSEADHDLKYTYYLLKSIGLENMNADSAVPGLNRDAVHACQILVPSYDEQRAIAHILGSLDDKIGLNRRMNETLEAMARAIFKSWFVDFDPVRAKAEGRDPLSACGHVQAGGLPNEIAGLFPDSFQDSELGEIPKGWKSRSLYDSAKYINGAAYRNFHFTDEEGALPVVKIAELKNGVTGQTKFTKTEQDDKYRIGDGEILLSWSGNPDTSIDTFVWSGGAAWLNQHIFRVLPHQKIEKHFIFYLLKYLRTVFAEIARDKQTTGLGHFTAQDMKRLMVIHPPEELLAKFNDLVVPIFDRWYGNLFESNSLASLRDTLLPKLISGELRIPDAEKFVEEAVV